jgi:hypothetical protein
MRGSFLVRRRIGMLHAVCHAEMRGNTEVLSVPDAVPGKLCPVRDAANANLVRSFNHSLTTSGSSS